MSWLIHLMPAWPAKALRAPEMRKRKSPLGRGRKRVHAKLTGAQVREIVDRRDRKGQSSRMIARLMHLPEAQVAGVVEGGNGIRTALINHDDGGCRA